MRYATELIDAHNIFPSLTVQKMSRTLKMCLCSSNATIYPVPFKDPSSGYQRRSTLGPAAMTSALICSYFLKFSMKLSASFLQFAL